MAATFDLSDEDLKKVLRQRCKERLLKNIESGEDGGTRSVEVLAKFKENDFLVHVSQQQQNSHNLQVVADSAAWLASLAPMLAPATAPQVAAQVVEASDETEE